MTVAFKCENCGGPVAADGYHLMGVPCDPQAARDAQARAINVTAKRVKGKKGYHATCELCGKEFTGKYHEVVSGEYAVHLSMNCDDPATWASFEQEVMRNIGKGAPRL